MLTKQDLRDIADIVQGEIRPFRKEMEDFMIVVANQFARVDKRFDMLETRIDKVETRLGAVESKLDGALLVLNNHENRISTLEDSSRRVQTKLKLS